MKKYLSALGALFVFFGYAPESQSAFFEISNFQSFEFPDAAWTIPGKINNSELIVGYTVDSGETKIDGFTYDGTDFKIFNSDFPQWRSEAFGVNDSGNIVGQWLDGYGYHGYLFDGSDFSSYDYPGTTNAYFRDISNNSEIVGGYLDADGFDHSLLYNGSNFTTIDPIFTNPVVSYTNSIAHGINDSGQVVGAYWDSATANSQRGYFFDGANYISIHVPGSIQTHAYDINNSGLIAGTSSMAGSANGFLYDGADFTSVMFPGSLNTTVMGINDSGQIVGHYDNGDSHNPKGFIASFNAIPDPDIEVTPTAYDFGDVPLGSPGTTFFTISNVGGGELTVENISLSEEDSFAITTPISFPVAITPDTPLEVEVTFDPDVSNYQYSSTIVIESDDPEEGIVDVSLLGKGVLASIPGDLDYDGDVDGADRNILRAALRTCNGDSGYNADADYDGDNCITFGDYRIWYGYYTNQ